MESNNNMLKRICHVTSVHPVTDTRIFWKECVSLSKLYEVCLIAANTTDKNIHGIPIFNVDLPKGRFRRQKCLGKVLDKMIEVDADIYHFHDPELMRIGLKIKKRGKKIIFDSHEDIPNQILDKQYIPKIFRKPISFFYSLYEENKLKHYDALITVTPSIVDRLKKINPQTYMVTNYPVLTEYKNKRSYWGGDKVCFAGGVCAQYMHENIIRALEKTNAHYILAGIVYPGYLEPIKKLKCWNRVDYRGILRHDEVYKIFDESVAGIVLIDYTPNVGYHQGTLGVLKMFEYMMAGIPVIATDFVLWKEIVEGYDCGICVNPHNINAISDAINFFVNNPEIAKEKGRNGRKAVEQLYNWSSQEKILFEIYQKLLNL